jgi:hypothetical protein
MSHPKLSLAALALALAAAGGPALAASSASSASSDSASTSVNSLSDSFGKSSDSSSGGKEKTAGDYRVIEVADAPARPGMLRMRLLALPAGAAEGAGGEFFLYVPQQAVAEGGVAAGQVVTARERPYGLEFARADTQRAFILLLTDDWLRELRTQAVTL